MKSMIDLLGSIQSLCNPRAIVVAACNLLMHSTLKQPTAHSVRLTTQKPSSLGHFPPSSSSLRLATTAPGSSHDSYWSLSVERLQHSALCAFGILPSRGFLRDKTSSVHPSTRTGLCRQLQLDENYASQHPLESLTVPY